MVPFIHLNGRAVEVDRLSSFSIKTPFEKTTIDFLEQWTCGKDTFQLSTSGSTGRPSKINIGRKQMVASAETTIDAFNLVPGNTLHLCLNTGFIAGKMMLVRALVGEMNVIAEEPASRPKALLDTDNDLKFTALIPLQLENLMADKAALSSLNKMKAIIVGGGPVHDRLEQDLQQITTPVYATFGMTETVSHIALRRLNGKERSRYYYVLRDINIDKDHRECLTINGPVTAGKTIVTNDRVRIVGKTRFEWLGRIDNVINSGGIKIQLEEVDKEISQIFQRSGIRNRSFTAGMPDKSLGQKLVLCIEGEGPGSDELMKLLKSALPKFHTPKKILFLKHFTETVTGKINRRKSLDSVGGSYW